MIIFTVSLFQLASASIIVVLASLALYLGIKLKHAKHVAHHAETIAQQAESLHAVDVLVEDTIIDLDEIHAKINPQTGTAKTDDYASLGDQEDVSMDDVRIGSSRSQAGVGDTNDFSCFRRHMSTPSAFLVKRWLPHDEALHQVVCDALFGSSASAIETDRNGSDARFSHSNEPEEPEETPLRVSTSQWNLLLLSLEPPVAKPALNVRTRSQAREEAAAQTGHVGTRSSHRSGGNTPATTDTQSEVSVIDFKEDDELEEQEEQYRALLVMALRLQGINYLCEATLEQAQKAIIVDGAFSDALDPRWRASWTAYR
eukprot:gene9513-6816_t